MYRRPIASFFMRVMLIDPCKGETRILETTDEEDRTTPEGQARLRVFRPMFWRDRDGRKGETRTAPIKA